MTITTPRAFSISPAGSHCKVAMGFYSVIGVMITAYGCTVANNDRRHARESLSMQSVD
jgi:hypothetical protein